MLLLLYSVVVYNTHDQIDLCCHDNTLNDIIILCSTNTNGNVALK